MTTILGVRYYNPREAAQALGVCERTVTALCRRKELGHHRIARRVLISERHLEKFLADTEVEPR